MFRWKLLGKIPRKGIIKIKYNLELKSGIPLSKDIVLSYFFHPWPKDAEQDQAGHGCTCSS